MAVLTPNRRRPAQPTSLVGGPRKAGRGFPGARATAVPRWAILAAYAVPLCVLPSAIWRAQLVVSGELPISDGGWYPLLLSVVSLVAASLTVGLVQRWGELWPRWVPHFGARPVPVRAAVVPAATGAALLIAISVYAVINLVFHVVERGPVLIGTRADEHTLEPPADWVALLYAPMLLWGPLLVAVTVQYYRRAHAGRRGHPS
jgi:hypothetical protein